MKRSILTGAISRGALVSAALTWLCVPMLAQQASITLKNSDVAYCYKQTAGWTLTKTNDAPPSVQPGTAVNWTITATKGSLGPKTLCAIGFVSVQNTGSAPATIGNIVVDLQRNTGKWTAISADVADATNGDAAIQDNIAAAALQNQTTYPASIVMLNGAAATFKENAYSGSLTFTDADNNTIWAITPQQTIAAGATVDLFFNAVFNVDSLNIPAGEQLRTEVFMTFGNSGTRGGSGASASGIDINGNGVLDADEAYVRTVPSRVTKPMPALQVCNDSVSITDIFGADPSAAVAIVNDQTGTGVFTSASASYSVTGTVSGSGGVTNTAYLDGSDSYVTLTIGTDPVTGLPITVDRLCCAAIHLSASSSVHITPFQPPLGHCSYTKGAFNLNANGAPAQLLVQNFAGYFPAGLTIGTQPQYWAAWTNLTALRTFLGSGGGASGKFTQNLTNPTSTSGGNLALQTAALAINIAFGPLYQYPGIGNLILTGTGTPLDGLSAAQVLNVANTALGTGVTPLNFGVADINFYVTLLNQSFDNCTESSWAVAHLQ